MMTTNAHLFSLKAAQKRLNLSLPRRAEFDSGLKESGRVEERKTDRVGEKNIHTFLTLQSASPKTHLTQKALQSEICQCLDTAHTVRLTKLSLIHWAELELDWGLTGVLGAVKPNNEILRSVNGVFFYNLRTGTLRHSQHVTRTFVYVWTQSQNVLSSQQSINCVQNFRRTSKPKTLGKKVLKCWRDCCASKSTKPPTQRAMFDLLM